MGVSRTIPPTHLCILNQILTVDRPILTPKASLKIFLFIGGVLLAIGVFWLAENDDVRT